MPAEKSAGRLFLFLLSFFVYAWVDIALALLDTWRLRCHSCCILRSLEFKAFFASHRGMVIVHVVLFVIASFAGFYNAGSFVIFCTHRTD